MSPLTSAQKQHRRRKALDKVAADLGYESHYRMMTDILNEEMEVLPMGPKLTVRKDYGGFVDWGNGWADPFDRIHGDALTRWPAPTMEKKVTYKLDQDDMERLSVDGDGRLNYD